MKKRLANEPTIHPSSQIVDSFIGEWTEIGPNTKIEESYFGDYSYTSGDAEIIYATIGKFCSIASHVRINPVNHPMWRVTQHHLTYRLTQYQLADEDDHDFFNWRREHHVTIGHDVWIGHGAIIMPGVSIGTGAVIGAGSVVTKDVPAYTIAVGVPAKPIKNRFSDEIAEKLMEIEWWNWDRKLIEERYKDLKNVEEFIKKYS
ncbi:DapH/DapD/GlmU-related protein [uncultured Metabacillus sp.]|uniref:DapH/DapD/GlmU-related protein n=1 Tax=uncultured Metabacillus sp. TaxID=2860135 RepID=UPI0026122667|nr:DapH/DapD/GlmU-related protein [uncultured Metabacillus sp.]